MLADIILHFTVRFGTRLVTVFNNNSVVYLRDRVYAKQ